MRESNASKADLGYIAKNDSVANLAEDTVLQKQNLKPVTILCIGFKTELILQIVIFMALGPIKQQVFAKKQMVARKGILF